MPVLIIAVGIIAVLLFFRKLNPPEERNPRQTSSQPIAPVPASFRPPSVDNLIDELEKKALAYAIYRELMRVSAPKEAKTSLYDQFSYVNLPPLLESEPVFTEHPELMSDRIFLEKLNNWIVQNGGSSQPSFFAASEAIGAMLVERKWKEATHIVAESISRTTG